MSVAVKESAEPRKPPPNKATGQRALRPSPKVMERTKEAKLRAAAILEVLAGVRTPTDAAKALAVSLPRYYLLEQQALEAMVRGCEPKTKGPGHSLQRQVAKLQREIARLQRENSRQQALVRAAQRSVGLVPPTPIRPDQKPVGKKRRTRRPTARALRLAQSLRTADAVSPASATVNEPSTP